MRKGVKAVSASMIWIAIAFLAAGVPSATAGLAGASTNEPYIVGFHSAASLPHKGDSFHGEAVSATRSDLSYALVSVPPTDVARFQAEARADPHVAYVEPDLKVMHADATPNDPKLGLQYDLKPD